MRNLSLTAALLLGPLMAMQCSGGPQILGEVNMTLLCAEDGGIKFSGVVTGFKPNTKFHYQFRVYFNGDLWFQDQSGDYYTDRYGTHFRMPYRYFNCGTGHYKVELWAVSDDGGTHSSMDHQAVFCNG